jgi:hypothetical protein
MPEYVPRYWDLDEHGNKKNKVFTGYEDMGGWVFDDRQIRTSLQTNDLRIGTAATIFPGSFGRNSQRDRYPTAFSASS